MKIALLQFEIIIDDAASLKDKRRIVKSVKDKLHREHQVSVAEIGDHQIWNRASLGLAAVSGDSGYLRGVLEAIIRKLKRLPEGRLGDAVADVVDVADVIAFEDDDGSPLWTEEERRAAPEVRP
jgi:uncharacterized protein YlxP (DUF503 family)